MLEQLPVLLLPWFAEHRRDLPWRRDREPYHVWLSEIMLQQTRVEAVRGYYLRFLERLPDIAALASAPEDVLLKLWEGLGYYSRVRNLQKAAQCVMEQHGGEFPQELSAIRALPGIGDYTAGAIASICFEVPAAAVDGNVLRVILRLTVCADSPADVRVRRRIGEELSAVYPAGHCGDFTQALMELARPSACRTAHRSAAPARCVRSAKPTRRGRSCSSRQSRQKSPAASSSAPFSCCSAATGSPSANVRPVACSPGCGSCRTCPASWKRRRRSGRRSSGACIRPVS